MLSLFRPGFVKTGCPTYRYIQAKGERLVRVCRWSIGAVVVSIEAAALLLLYAMEI